MNWNKKPQNSEKNFYVINKSLLHKLPSEKRF
jgi:hypothetical protein